MAIYHCSIKIGSRSAGRSAVAASAYRSGEKLQDRETGITHDYTRKSGIVHSEILLPRQAPSEYQNREVLWNAVQEKETQSNAQLFREVEVALPVEFSRELQIEVVRDYVNSQFVAAGMCADWSLHDKGDGNPHAHIMLTTRGIKDNGQWDVKERKAYAIDEYGERIPIIDPETGEQKVRIRKGKGEEKLWERITVQANDWNDKGKADIWRAAWADICNKHLDKSNEIDHRSYEKRGIEIEPTIHEGYTARQMGVRSERVQTNTEIRARNKLLAEIQSKLQEIEKKIKGLMRGEKLTLRERLTAVFDRIGVAAAAAPDMSAQRGDNDADGHGDPIEQQRALSSVAAQLPTEEAATSPKPKENAKNERMSLEAQLAWATNEANRRNERRGYNEPSEHHRNNEQEL